jgi:hypothetical protein
MENKVWRNWNNFFLGLVVALLPWLGVPQVIKNVAFLIIGLLITLFSLVNPLARRTMVSDPPHDTTTPTV